MFDQLIERCNRLSEPWSAWMGISILETTLVLVILSGLWFVLKRRSSPQLGALLFLLVPLRLLIPVEVRLPGLPTAWRTSGTESAAAVPAGDHGHSHQPMPQNGELTRGSVANPSAETVLANRRATPPAQPTSRLTVSSWLMLGWGFGVLFLLGRFCVAQRKLASLLNCATETDLKDYSIDLAELCRRMGVRRIRVLQSGSVQSPSVAGVFRPTVILPVGVLESLTIRQREWILLHELAHVRRHNLIMNCLQRIAAILYFPNPAVWIANRNIHRLSEYACDDLASSAGRASPIEASEAFLSVMKNASIRPRPMPSSAMALGMSNSRSQSAFCARMNRLLNAELSVSLRFGARSLMILLLTACIALPRLRGMPPADSETSAADITAKDAGAAASEHDGGETTALKPARHDFSVVVAEHVLLLDGDSITTWEVLDNYIEAVPDPLRPYPHFYITRGAMAAEKYEPAKEKIWDIRRKYKLAGHSEGSLWPRTDFRYDRIRTADDLKPDPALQKSGTILADGKPVTGAEVVLITPVDDSISYKTYHMALIEGRIRNRLEHVMTLSDALGTYTLYPPRDRPYYVLALHPQAGFSLVAAERVRTDPDIRLSPWGGIVTSLEDAKNEQHADLKTKIEACEGRPEISIDQYWSDLQRKEKSRTFSFKHVPTIYRTSISRSFPSPDGGSTSLPAATVSLLPGETRRIDFGEVTKEQLDWLKTIRGL